jgi:Ca2+-binding EF-hand superfamily protein
MEGDKKPLATLEFTFDQKKVLNPQEMTALVKAFRNYDVNNDAVMDEKEFKNIMIDLGYRKITDEKVAEMLNREDKN